MSNEQNYSNIKRANILINSNALIPNTEPKTWNYVTTL
jgi:hypothetical protein